MREREEREGEGITGAVGEENCSKVGKGTYYGACFGVNSIHTTNKASIIFSFHGFGTFL